MPLDGGDLEIQTAEVFLPLLQELIRIRGQDEEVRYLGAHGGRGSAKSHFFAELLVERCVMQPYTRAVCIRETQISLKYSSKQLIEDKIQDLEVERYFDVKKSHIDVLDRRGQVCGVIIFQGMQNHTAVSIKSLEGFDIAWVEEGQSLSQLSLDLLRPTIRKPRSQIWFSWNPDDDTDPVDVFLRAQKPDNAIVVESNFRDNPWFPDVLREEMEYDKRRDPDRYEHIWLGKYRKNSGARVFRNWKIADDLSVFRSNSSIRYYHGIDFGFANDPSVLIRCYVEGRTLYITNEAYAVGCELDYTPFLFGGVHDGELRSKNSQAWNSLAEKGIPDWPGVPHARKWPITADSSDPQAISYLKRHGFDKIRGAIKGPNSIHEGVEFLKSFDIVVHPNCIHTIDELTMYSYEVDKKNPAIILPKLQDKKNHVIDALRYAIEPLRRGRIGVH